MLLRTTPLVLALALLSLPATHASQDALARAREHLAAEAWDEAIEELETVLAEEETNAQAWMLLGAAMRGSGAWEDAASVFEIAAGYGAVAGEAHFQAACLYAQNERPEDALRHVAEAVEAGYADRSKLLYDPALEAVRARPAFAELVPPIPASETCFVEDVRVLHTFYGESPGDVFGWIGRDLGDVDGDGRSDLLISAPYRAEGGPSAGKIYVYSGASGELLYTHTGQPGEGLGMGIEEMGDVNGDGVRDAGAGAPNLGNGPGRAYVYGGATGEVLLTLSAGIPGDAFGRKLCGGVDFDGDGADDLFVGAPGVGPDGQGPGRGYLYSGKTGKVLAELEGERAGDAFGVSNAMWSNGEVTLLAVGAGNAGPRNGGRVSVYRWEGGELVPFFTIEADATGVALGGMFVCFPGDMNGDGVSEVYASDWQNAAKGSSTGRIYVHSGADGAQLFTLEGDRQGDGFGTCTADVGDVDGDGAADLLVGAWQVREAAPSGGKCTLYSGATREVLATYTCNVNGETLGFDTTGVGDLDGDGGIDFLVTGGYSNVLGPRSGRSFVIAGPVPKD